MSLLRTPASPHRMVAVICLAEVLSMTGFAAYPALLTTLSTEWAMSATQAGFVGGAFFFGYMLAVPVLSGITDRLDARRVYLVACSISSLGTAGFGLLADGVWSGALAQVITGIGLAGTYMPGLKALTDRVDGPRQSRFIAFYTASFGIGTTLSLLAVGWLAAVFPWRVTFMLLALGPVTACLVMALRVPPKVLQAGKDASWLPRFSAVLVLPDTRRYILGYAAHCWELFGLRAWLVAFVVFAFASGKASSPPLSATEVAALINLVGLPASVLGNEAAGMLGRQRWITFVMLASGTLCWLVGLSASWPWWLMLSLLVIYFVTVMLDSAALTSGMVQATPPALRGSAMAVHSLFGFGAGFLAPLVFGATLDLAGGADVVLAWWIAFATLGLASLGWALTGRHLKRQ